MVHFAYSHIAFVTLLTFATVKADQPWSKQRITDMLSITNNNIHGVKPVLDDAEKAVQILKDKILSQNASLQGDLEKYMNCLRTAYKYIWGQEAINRIAVRLARTGELMYEDTVECCQKITLEYYYKTEEFPIENCFKNMPSAPHEDLHQMNLLTRTLFDHKHWVSIEVFFKHLYETQLKELAGY
ncbi:unnamed protein product [Trichobilharzia szidati]|nr:unnamed protein product [Trichobilharzia szidati]